MRQMRKVLDRLRKGSNLSKEDEENQRNYILRMSNIIFNLVTCIVRYEDCGFR